MPAASGLPGARCSRSSPSIVREPPQRDRAERQVDEKQPAPAGVVDDEAADHRPADAREREDDREVALVARAQPRRDDLADERLRERHQAAAADPLHDARRDQRAERRRRAAGERAEGEDDDRDRQHLAPAEAVAETPVERHHDHRGEQVGDREPRRVAQAAELAADHRRRGREQGLVDRGEEHRHHDGDEEAPEARPVERRRGAAAGATAGDDAAALPTRTGASIVANPISGDRSSRSRLAALARVERRRRRGTRPARPARSPSGRCARTARS